MQRAAGNRAAVRSLQRKSGDAAQYIKANGLALKARYEAVWAFVQDPRNPQNHRVGLQQAWNLNQSAEFIVPLDPPVSQTTVGSKGSGVAPEEGGEAKQPPTESKEAEGGPSIAKGPTLLEVLLPFQVLGLDIPRLEMSSGFCELVLWAMPPGGRFVVGDVVGEAAVEDADEAVAEGP